VGLSRVKKKAPLKRGFFVGLLLGRQSEQRTERNREETDPSPDDHGNDQRKGKRCFAEQMLHGDLHKFAGQILPGED
jgi:hypothetical protein